MKKHLVLLPFIFLFVLGCSLIDKARDDAAARSDPRKSVNVPTGIRNARHDSQIYSEKSGLVLMPNRSEFLFGAETAKLTKEELARRLERFDAGSTAVDVKSLYLAVNAENDYGSLADLFELAAEKNFVAFNLVVKPVNENEPSGILTVRAPDEFEKKYYAQMVGKIKEGESLNLGRPNPNTLLLEIKAGGKLLLNKEESALPELVAKLSNIFRVREETGVFRIGTNEIEKTLFVRGARSVKYGEFAAIVDALAQSGAVPIVVLTHDLVE